MSQEFVDWVRVLFHLYHLEIIQEADVLHSDRSTKKIAHAIGIKRNIQRVLNDIEKRASNSGYDYIHKKKFNMYYYRLVDDSTKRTGQKYVEDYIFKEILGKPLNRVYFYDVNKKYYNDLKNVINMFISLNDLKKLDESDVVKKIVKVMADEKLLSIVFSSAAKREFRKEDETEKKDLFTLTAKLSECIILYYSGYWEEARSNLEKIKNEIAFLSKIGFSYQPIDIPSMYHKGVMLFKLGFINNSKNYFSNIERIKPDTETTVCFHHYSTKYLDIIERMKEIDDAHSFII